MKVRLNRPEVIWGARLLLVLLLGGIGWIALIPVGDIPVTTWWDKADHALGFLVLGLVAQMAFPRQSFLYRLFPALLAYGVAIELAQSFTATRSASLSDIVADLVGLLLAGGLARWLVRGRTRPAAIGD